MSMGRKGAGHRAWLTRQRNLRAREHKKSKGQVVGLKKSAKSLSCRQKMKAKPFKVYVNGKFEAGFDTIKEARGFIKFHAASKGKVVKLRKVKKS
jgi:hypothetical protein